MAYRYELSDEDFEVWDASDHIDSIQEPLTAEEWIRENLDAITATYHALYDYLNTFGMPHILCRLSFDRFADLCYEYST